MIEEGGSGFSFIALILKGNRPQADLMRIENLYPEGCRDVSQSAWGNPMGTRSDCAGAWREVLELSCVYFSDPFRWDAEGSEEVAFELVTVWLDGDGSLHTEQPSIPLFVTNGKLFVKSRNADRAIVLLKQPGASQPTAQEVGQLLARFG